MGLDVQRKRVYDPPTADDGKRVLVDRLWPRGIKKEAAAIDAWLRDVAPSPALRKWFCHKPELFPEFRARYEAELVHDPLHREQLDQLCAWAQTGRVTLVYAAKDPVHNHVVVLQDVLMRWGGETSES
ncbi:MAG: DUF488 family protein [Alicyclobacillus herbarius]|uniref:DUF488 domain-containing protein n=1 Tax=Alicyclobacillus herbarius TaxID=122960 RepID=UPI00054F25D3|nr:DUF488 family protein [Alicyclobacillus herbarius]MCL6632634.1 DUF488 family protein [Alicyclobacillus herbarius]